MRIIYLFLLLMSSCIFAHNGSPYLIELAEHDDIFFIKFPKDYTAITYSKNHLCKKLSFNKFKVTCAEEQITHFIFDVSNKLPKQQVIIKFNDNLHPLPLFDGDKYVRFEVGANNHSLAFLKSGFEHLLVGWDHIALLILIVLNQKFIRNIIIIITWFSIGHGLVIFIVSTLQYKVHFLAIELLIALSILFYARQTLLYKQENNSDSISDIIIFWFLIGLIHGAGLASNLSVNYNLSFMDIIAFTIGIDVAQLLIITVLLCLVRLLNTFTQSGLIKIKHTLSYIFLFLSSIKIVHLFI